MKKVYAEIGWGNESFLNTEIETWDKEREISEIRKKGFFLPKKINEIYFRFWLGGYNVYIFSSKKGLRVKKKNKKRFKILFGIGGEG